MSTRAGMADAARCSACRTPLHDGACIFDECDGKSVLEDGYVGYTIRPLGCEDRVGDDVGNTFIYQDLEFLKGIFHEAMFDGCKVFRVVGRGNQGNVFQRDESCGIVWRDSVILLEYLGTRGDLRKISPMDHG